MDVTQITFFLGKYAYDRAVIDFLLERYMRRIPRTHRKVLEIPNGRANILDDIQVSNPRGISKLPSQNHSPCYCIMSRISGLSRQ